MAALNTSIEHIPFRLKDLIHTMQNKETNIKIYTDDIEIDYEDMVLYKDYWVVDIGVWIEEPECTPILKVSISDNI